MQYLKYTFKLTLFWLSLFLINRIVFALFFMDQIVNSSLIEVLTIIPKSFILDLSFVCYLFSILLILFWINTFLKNKKLLNNIVYGIVGFFIFLTGIIAGAEVSLYAEWETKLNFTALSHLAKPSEVYKTASSEHMLTSILFLSISLFFFKVYSSSIHVNIPYNKTINSLKKVLVKLILLPILLGVLLLGIRGGTQPIPVNLSNAYYSKNIILNDIAVNANWNILQSLLKSKSSFKGNPYKKYPESESQAFIAQLSENKADSTLIILNNKMPNIVFILLESWSADNIESLAGLKGITPHFNALEKEGLLFTDFYSNGWTSDQGMSSIFSSFPVFPYVAVINQTDKSRRLPCLNKSLKEKGYHSSYFFGGQLTYGNIKGYLLAQGFDLVKDEDDFKHLPSGSLGVHDEFMFSEFKKELKQLPEPFMSTLFTISSHSPFDFPDEHKLSFNHKDDKYVNSVAYTDKRLGKFMARVKDEKWYKNTLFIIVADHSHSSPKGWRIAQKERFKIPMLWMGEVLKKEYKGKQHSKIGSHIDISSSLLAQLSINNTPYLFGNDLFNPKTKSLVPYAFHKGYGLIRPGANYAFSESYNKVFELQTEDSLQIDIIKKETELYFQAAFRKYLDL
jgi:phosphoglycerol transferase MdoB-like AlkP superfamily enzyme